LLRLQVRRCLLMCGDTEEEEMGCLFAVPVTGSASHARMTLRSRMPAACQLHASCSYMPAGFSLLPHAGISFS
ncbi:hypothetical protein CLOM_g4120, partial [Closterium sp. NIES-68]